MQIRARLLVLVPGITLVLAAGRAHALTATTADDVCAADADPCNVTDVVHVTDGAVLDFASRTVSVTGGGAFDFGAGSGEILSGPFHASTSKDAIVASGPGSSGGSDSGSITIAARRSCSGGTSPQPCSSINGCQLGTCTARRCTGNAAHTCAADSDCNVGPCSGLHRCSGSAALLRCSTNADCELGTCPAQLTCASLGFAPKNCVGDADCDFGECTVGTGSISMDAGIEGASDFPAAITLHAVDSVTVTGPVDVSGRKAESDGGSFEVTTEAGDITIGGRIRATSGGAAGGGYVSLDSGRDVTIGARIDAGGGDYDGGGIDLTSERDILIDDSITADSRDGGGSGGYMDIDAERNLRIGGGSRRLRLSLNGHKSGEAGYFGGGGDFNLYADGDIVVGSNVRIATIGPAPDSYAGTIYIIADGGLSFDGQIIARTRGKTGAGGGLSIETIGPIWFGENSLIDVSGRYEGDGGWAEMVSYDGDADISGSWKIGAAGDFNVDACRIRFAGNVGNKSLGVPMYLTAYESMQLLAGSVINNPNGTVHLTYRTSDKPPVINGTVTPAPMLDLDGTLTGCPVCGNSEIDEGETCDDGNTASGDGCDSSCLLE